MVFEQLPPAVAAPAFDVAVAALRIAVGTLARLSRDAACIFAVWADFTVLHLVASAHALWTLLPYAESRRIAVEDYVVAFVAALRAGGVDPAVVPRETVPRPCPEGRCGGGCQCSREYQRHPVLL